MRIYETVKRYFDFFKYRMGQYEMAVILDEAH